MAPTLAAHAVHTPDLFDGATFGGIEEGLDCAKQIGFDELIERGVRSADELPHELVYAGFSLGEVPAQRLAQTRKGARGTVVLLVRTYLRVRRDLATGRAGSDPRHGRRSDLRG